MNRIKRINWSLTLLGLLLTWFFIWVALTTRGVSPLDFDTNLINYIYSWRDGLTTTWMLVVSALGKEAIYFASLVIVVWLTAKKNWRDLGLYVTLVGGGLLLNLMLKFFISRERPSLDVLIHEPGHSFPSGHSMGAFIFYALMVYWIWRSTRSKTLTWIASIVGILIVVGVGLSRVYLGAHFPSDVLGAYIAGALWLLASYLMRSAKPW